MYCSVCGNQGFPGAVFCTTCGHPLIKRKFEFQKRRILVFVSLSALIGILVLFFIATSKATKDYGYDLAVSSVVNIYCDGVEGGSGGSGTIMTDDGYVLTNAHIIPEQSEAEQMYCLVSLPDPSTGNPNEIYVAYPIIIPELSEEYDLAFVKIHDVYYDAESGQHYGEYPKQFTSYDFPDSCLSAPAALGDSIRVYGYPALSGGYALTITDGVVSSVLVDDGLIVTSAKISSGNSGGLAVNQSGCMVGVPSMVVSDENESFGVIISTDVIRKFVEEIPS